MIILLYHILASIILAIEVLGFSYPLSPTQEDTEYNATEIQGLVDGDTHLRILHVEGDMALVGAKNRLYNVSMSTMMVQNSFPWISSAENTQKCQNEFEFFKNDCSSYIRSVLKVSDTVYTVCASSARFPACKSLTSQNGSWQLGEDTNADTIQAYAPTFPDEHMLIHTTKEGMTYTATHFHHSLKPFHILFKEKTEGTDGIGALSTMPDNTDYMNSDEKTGFVPEYVSLFDTESHVYMTYKEPALETWFRHGVQKRVYSRLARVCKGDKGRKGLQQTFATFFKTRLLCGIPERTLIEGKLMNSTEGYYSYYFDEIADTTDPHLSTYTSSDGEQIVIAIFNSHRNSMGGSAICAYKLKDIEETFDNSPQMAHTLSSDDQWTWETKPIVGRPPAKCPDQDTNSLSTEESEKSNYPLLKNPVRAINDSTLFIVTDEQFKMTKLVVDWGVTDLQGKTHDVIFVGTDNGEILKLVQPGPNQKLQVIEKRQVFHDKTPIQEMKLVIENGEKHLILNNFKQMKKIPLQKCHNVASCDQCVALQDPYCAYIPDVGCRQTSHDGSNKVQNILTGRATECLVTTTQATEVASYEKSTATIVLKTESPPVRSDSKLEEKPATAASKEQVKQSNVTYIALLVILPLGCLVGGFLLGILYIKKFKNKSATKYLDELSENRMKDNSSKLDCDAYQTMPKTNNIPYKNNLNTKTTNGSTSMDTNALNLANGPEKPKRMKPRSDLQLSSKRKVSDTALPQVLTRTLTK